LFNRLSRKNYLKLIELISQFIENSHFLVIHFSIALLPSAFLLDTIAILFKSSSAENGSWWCLVLGSLGSIFAIITGFMADNIYGHMSFPFPILTTHGAIQIIASLLFSFLLLWRFENKHEIPCGKLRKYYFFIESIAVATIFYGSHLGAILSGRI
tara:strand:+ start:789 stop:1256 length:468 start_codon:yes stop_codon:yes gene_type:complete